MPIKTKSVSTILSKCLNQIYKFTEITKSKDLIATIKREKPDLVILEVNLNEVDGIDVCTDLRSDVTFAKLPIILFPIMRMISRKLLLLMLVLMNLFQKHHVPN
ncbi:MAG: response regulator [Saprospirales bacterium]|nr:response regulator [Saprospirales bacterium]